MLQVVGEVGQLVDGMLGSCDAALVGLRVGVEDVDGKHVGVSLGLHVENVLGLLIQDLLNGVSCCVQLFLLADEVR